MRIKQRGNVLFIILIGIALFAALSFVITQSGQGGGSTDKEELNLQATRVLQVAKDFSSTVRRLRSIGDCSKDDISFHHTDWGHNDYLHAPALDSGCRVFEDGQMLFIQPEAEWLDTARTAEAEYGNYLFYEKTCIADVGTGGAAPSCNGTDGYEELIMFVPWITLDLCMELNNKLGIANPSGEPPNESANAYNPAAASHKFNGNYSRTYIIGSGGGDAANFNGQYSACFQGFDGASTPKSGTYHFYHVLIAR